MTEEAAGNKRRQNKLLSVVPTPILDALFAIRVAEELLKGSDGCI